MTTDNPAEGTLASSVAPLGTVPVGGIARVGAQVSTPTLNDPEPIQIGAQAPEFTLTDHYGREIHSDTYRGVAVLLVFLPFAFSNVCTGELQALRDAEQLHNLRPLEILVVTCDSKFTLGAWAGEEQYPGVLLSDFWPHGQVTRAFGVFDELHGQPFRATFLLDEQGVVRWSVVNSVGEPRSIEHYVDAVAALP